MTVDQAFQLALQHHQAGRIPEAEGIYRQILTAQSNHADALHLLGVAAHQLGKNDAAAELIQRAIAVTPGRADFLTNLGEVWRQMGRRDRAFAALQEAVRLQPDSVEAWNNLGNTLADDLQYAPALEAFRAALRLKPDYAMVRNNMGNVLRDAGSLDEACAEFRAAIQLQPGFAEAHNNLGNTLSDFGQLEPAVAAYRTAIQLKPDYAVAQNNLGNALRDLGRLDEAATACRAALSLRPGYAVAHSNLGGVLRDIGQADLAVAEYREALRLRPELVAARDNLLFCQHYVGGDPREIFEEHRQWDTVHGQPLAEGIGLPANDRNLERRLRLGYVSPDFREHPVAYFIEGLLAQHDREHFEVFCYASVHRPDRITARFRALGHQWRDIRHLPDADAAALVRADQVDILVDLAGHTAGNRLRLFARKPAPVQVTYLGYPDTTGLRAIDYRLTDAHADPVGATEQFHTEELHRLPGCAWCYRPPDEAPPVNASPVVSSGTIAFGCFNTRPKVTESMLLLWAKILAQVPGSRLLLKDVNGQSAAAMDFMRIRLEKAGIAPPRVEWVDFVPTVGGYLSHYARVDIALDTFPYHGTTTTCEALWMGVPVVTLAGQTHVSRVGVSLLHNAGLPELIAGTPDDYVRIAVNLAGDVPRLATLRATLRARLAASPLMDAPRLARNVENTYREMWRAWCARQPLHSQKHSPL